MERYFYFDRSKSLEDLDDKDWGELNFESHVIQACYSLRKKPLNEFTIEDLRIMIGQGINLEYLIPLAIEELEEDIFIKGDYYKGDLLEAVLQVDAQFWKSNIQLKEDIEGLIGKEIKYLKDKLNNFRGGF